MDATHFDRIAKVFADRRLSRRDAVRQGGAGLAAGALAAAGRTRSAHAQEATPPAAEAGDKPMFLFLQAFRSGSLAPKEGAEGRYTLTLEHGLGQTVYFSDRPERLVGASPTPQFLAGLGFPADNPPNAALVVEQASGETEIAVVELFSPVYDEATHTATYEVAVLDEWEDTLGVDLTETPADLAAFGSEFGAAHLFIDDCPKPIVYCGIPNFDGGDNVGNLGPQYLCWEDCCGCMSCVGDQVWADRCNQAFAACNGNCIGYMRDGW